MARVFMIVLAIGLVPLAIGAVAIQRQSLRDKKETLDHALTADAYTGSADLALTMSGPSPAYAPRPSPCANA